MISIKAISKTLATHLRKNKMGQYVKMMNRQGTAKKKTYCVEVNSRTINAINEFSTQVEKVVYDSSWNIKNKK